MKIYIIIGNNGELYDDYYEWIEAVYLSKENAKKELKKLRKETHRDKIRGILFTEFNYKIEEYETKDRMENINENNKQK